MSCIVLADEKLQEVVGPYWEEAIKLLTTLGYESET